MSDEFNDFDLFAHDAQKQRDQVMFAEAIKRAHQMMLYEGLPDRSTKLYADEIAHKKVLMLHNFAFYEELLPLRQEDAPKLTAICCNPDSFDLSPWETLCDFHADYCIEWRNGDETSRFLVCFGCEQLWGYRAINSAIFNMSKAGAEQLKGILVPYQKNHPPKTRKDL